VSTAVWARRRRPTTTVASRFAGFQPGRYSLQATKRAWLDANYGASRLGRPGTPVAVRDGESVTNLEMRMTRGSVIAGTVRDPSGEPQPGVQIRVMRFVMSDGARALERPITANMNDPITDDDGGYRVFGLPPGDYIVVAALRISQSGGLGGEELRLENSTGEGRTYAPVFFPGTTDMNAATVVRIGPAEQRIGVDIPFGLHPTARVVGSVTLPAATSSTGDRRERPECRMTPAGFEDLMSQPLAASVGTVVQTRPGEGRVVFTGIPPGRYSVVCAVGSSGSGPTGGRTLMLAGWAEASIVVNGQDQEIGLAMGPGGSISGQIAFDAATPPNDVAQFGMVEIRGFGKARLLSSDFDTPPAKDGTFAFNTVVTGRFIVTARLPRDSRWVLKSVTLGDRDLFDQPLEMAAGDRVAGVMMTFTDRPSELTGTLTDAGGRPAAEFHVVAFTTDRARWTPTTRRIQTVRPGSDGSFSIKGLPAGDYYLAALTDVEPGEWLAPEFLDQIVPASVRVTVKDRERTVQALRIARNP
jgi:hypothetical protein